MFLNSLARKLALPGAIAAAFVATLAASESARISPPLVSESSPVAENVAALLDGWKLAEAYANEHSGCEVFVGRGDSMLPLYRDRTVLVVRSVPMADLRVGMTVVFTGDQGQLVAHTLVEKTLSGWRAIGLGNREPDRTRVQRRNLVGVVVKAYAAALPGSVVAAQ